MTEPSTLPTRALLAESAWLRRLARRLVADEGRAEDAVQDTLVAALDREHGGRVPGRAWLSTVLRNLVRLDRRGGARRAARERRAVEDGAGDAPGTDLVAARLEVHRRLVEAVDALKEPFRTTIWLRFLEDLPPREVARRMEVPVKTVHSRVERALALLRARLDGMHGGRRELWSLALAELGTRPVVTGPWTWFGPVGALAMGTVFKWTAAAVGLALVGILWQVNRGSETVREAPGPLATGSADEPEMPGPATDSGGAPTGTPKAREALQEIAASVEPPPVDPGPVPTFEGRVVDLRGDPVADLEVELEVRYDSPKVLPPEARRTRSGPGGVFHLPVTELGGTLYASGPGLATVIAPGLVGGMPPEPPQIVVGPAVTYAGVVVDPQGAPVPDAELLIQLPVGFEAAGSRQSLIDVPLDRVRSDPEGTFRLRSVGHVQGLRLLVRKAGFQLLEEKLPAATVLDMTLELERSGEAGTLAGRVVDGEGEPLAGVLVSTGQLGTRSGEDGSFLLEPDQVEGTVLRALKEGFLPASQSLENLSSEAWTQILLVLDQQAKSIRGRVLDAAGDPVPQARVWTDDTERFGDVLHRVGSINAHMSVEIESILSGQFPGEGGYVTADERGNFELGGLTDRPYTLQAIDPRSLEVAQPVTLPAGSGAAVLRTVAEPRSPIAGRVLNYAGEPMTGVRIRANRVLTGEPYARTPRGGTGARAETDADGAFRFEGLTLSGATLTASHDSVRETLNLEELEDPSKVEIRLAAACHLRVVLETDPDLAEKFLLLDRDGRSMTIQAQIGEITLATTIFSFHQGSSGLIRTTEAAATLVLRDAQGTEVHREPLRLVPGEVTEIRL